MSAALLGLKAEKQKAIAFGTVVGGADASTQLGMEFTQKQYENRVKALTEPKTYATDRAAGFKKVKDAVNDKFIKSLDTYLKTGMPPEMAKKFALQAAANEKAIQMQIFEVDFPSGANVLEQGRSIALANTANYEGGMPARRRAPTRRRPARRRRR